MSTPDPITCPECGGTMVEWVAGMALACEFCNGRGHDGRPQWTPENPPPRPPVWADPRWNDPQYARLNLCRYCLGAREVTHLNEVTRTMVMVSCPGCAGRPSE
ncbi:hypothetical protein ABZ297_25750 [Nonomuraea sp. NPDC005983]|uniref:hypothetical protein n=1 Tax=Nonomuraea sp. NPDC005983 TaxID=3155595 RepID=UPI0033BB326C